MERSDTCGAFVVACKSLGTMRVNTELAWLKQIFDAQADHMAVLDAEGRIIAVNEAWKRFARDNGAGDSEAYLGSNYLTICNSARGEGADIAKACYQGLKEVLAGERSEFSLEYPCHSATLQRWFMFKVRPLEQGAVVTHTDISQHEQKSQRDAQLQSVLLATTNELLTQEVTPEFYQRLLEQAVELIPGAQAGSVTVRGEDNRFHFVAAVGFDLTGLSEVSFDESELFFAGQGLPVNKSYLVMGVDTINLKSLDAKRLRQLREAGHAERIKVTLGVPIYISNQISATLSFDNFDDANAFDQEAREIAEALGTQVGLILQHLRDKESLQKSETLFSTLFHQNPTPTFLTSVGTHRVLDANESLLELIGYNYDEVVGTKVMELPFLFDQRFQDDVRALQGGKAVLQVERTLRTKSGALRTTLGSVVPVEVEGQPCFLTTFVDISEHKRTEEQLTQAIQEVMQDAHWFSHSVMEKLAHMNPRIENTETTELTERETQVLAMIAKGKHNTDIGKDLGISSQTVRNYVSQIYSKLGIRSRAEAVVWARERGLVS